ncbi:MAG: hypothetical protein WKI04_02405, partial [Ferruginibacter sp.]
AISERLSVIIDKCLKVSPANRISATGIEALFISSQSSFFSKLSLPAKKFLVPVIGAFAFLLVLFLFIYKKNPVVNEGPVNHSGSEEPINHKPASGNEEEKMLTVPSVGGNKVIINAPGISNAELITKEGAHQPLPFTFIGREGEKFEFTIRAEGYIDKQAQVVITPRRMSYEFNLEKNYK